MARFKRLDVLNAMLQAGVVPVCYESDVEAAINIVQACADGGANVFEFTNRGDGAYEVFSALVKHFASHRPEVILGVGSIVDAGTASLYMSCGANFVVGPVLNPDVAKVCNRRKIAYAPGCGSASEISQAEELGVEICKVFPGLQVGGPAFVKMILGPCPWTSIMPTGGVQATRESIDEWFRAGVACVGMGSDLIRKEWLQSGDYSAITKNVVQVRTWIQETRKSL